MFNYTPSECSVKDTWDTGYVDLMTRPEATLAASRWTLPWLLEKTRTLLRGAAVWLDVAAWAVNWPPAAARLLTLWSGVPEYPLMPLEPELSRTTSKLTT